MPIPVSCNVDMRPAEIRQYCVLDETSQALMKTAMNQLQLSARARPCWRAPCRAVNLSNQHI